MDKEYTLLDLLVSLGKRGTFIIRLKDKEKNGKDRVMVVPMDDGSLLDIRDDGMSIYEMLLRATSGCFYTKYDIEITPISFYVGDKDTGLTTQEIFVDNGNIDLLALLAAENRLFLKENKQPESDKDNRLRASNIYGTLMNIFGLQLNQTFICKCATVDHPNRRSGDMRIVVNKDTGFYELSDNSHSFIQAYHEGGFEGQATAIFDACISHGMHILKGGIYYDKKER